MWEDVLSWRLTRSRVLSVTAGALVMAASLASPRFADTFAFGAVQRSVSNGLCKDRKSLEDGPQAILKPISSDVRLLWGSLGANCQDITGMNFQFCR